MESNLRHQKMESQNSTAPKVRESKFHGNKSNRVKNLLLQKIGRQNLRLQKFGSHNSRPQKLDSQNSLVTLKLVTLKISYTKN